MSKGDSKDDVTKRLQFTKCDHVIVVERAYHELGEQNGTISIVAIRSSVSRRNRQASKKDGVLQDIFRKSER